LPWDHTYLLFGLSGELGRSLATWMVRHGARHIVLTSRHPVVDEEWVRHLNAQGAHLRFVSNDITDRAAVAELIAEIRASKHPIAGVANGAMVLQDTPVRELSLDVLNRTLRPKVDGSRYLDELLRNDDLDFTVFFSSLASIFGSHGQSSYTTANMYMTSLAGQRRRRGYAASVIAIGAVTGIGYMARELTDKEMLRFTDSGYSPLSERDFHQLFAEAIVRRWKAAFESKSGGYLRCQHCATGRQATDLVDGESHDWALHHQAGALSGRWQVRCCATGEG
jgi:hybrid polyketide synthase/nonribosomal peptide synthetase ACE1